MRNLVPLLALFVASLLVASCGAEEGEAPDESTAVTTVTKPDIAQTTTLNIINSSGERIEVEVEIADDDTERQRGLMGRTELDEDSGMLFVYEAEQPRSFWMKDTLLPLSIAYIAADGHIVDIQDMQPLDETSYPSAEPARYALEVNQGFFTERGIQVGDRLDLPER